MGHKQQTIALSASRAQNEIARNRRVLPAIRLATAPATHEANCMTKSKKQLAAAPWAMVSLSPEAHHQALELTRTMAVDVEYWPTHDATIAQEAAGSREQILDAYRQVRDQLFSMIAKRFAPDGSPAI